MTPGFYALASCVRGDTWPGVPSIRVLFNGAPPAVPVQSARLQFRTSPDASDVGYELSTAGTPGGNPGQIVIVDAAAWTFALPRQPLALGAGTWSWDLETTDTAGVVQTYLAGTLTLQQDVTR